MTILAVSHDSQMLCDLFGFLRQLQPDAHLLCCESSPEALAAARTQEIDVAFLEVRLEEMDGLLLGRYLKDLHPFINLVYLTENREDAFAAMDLRASGCVLLPVTEACIEKELQELRFPLDAKRRSRVFAQTFGNFELFVDGKPVAFKYSRTKEIVALLVNNRGAQTTNGEIIACLWEDDGDPEKKMSYLSNLRQDLQNTLTRLHLNGIILKQRGSMAIAADRIECDLYDWLERGTSSRYRYMGEYMNQYSWAELMHAELDELSYAVS